MSTAVYRGQGVTLLASAARTTSSNSGALSGTATIPACAACSLLLDVTAFTGELAGVTGFDVYLDTSPDGGTTYYAVKKFATVTVSTGAQVLNFRTTGIGAVEAASSQWITTTTTNFAAINNNAVLGTTNRLRWTLPNNTVYSHSVTFTVQAITQPIGATP